MPTLNSIQIRPHTRSPFAKFNQITHDTYTHPRLCSDQTQSMANKKGRLNGSLF